VTNRSEIVCGPAQSRHSGSRTTPAATIAATSLSRCSGLIRAGSVGSSRSRRVAIGLSPYGRCPQRHSLRDRRVVWQVRAYSARYWLHTRCVNRMVGELRFNSDEDERSLCLPTNAAS